MKIGIFHDYFDSIGGAEKLVLTLARELGADVITTDVNEDCVRQMEFEDVNVIKIGNSIKRPIFRQISTSIRFARCDFSKKYDFFIFSGNWSPFAAKKHKPNIFYCHSPVRSFYDLYDLILKESSLRRSIFVIWAKLHKKIYENNLNHIQGIATNSKNTKSRIKKFLKKDSDIVYPPVNTSKYKFQKYGDFWLSVNRIYPEKRIELQIDSFKLIPEENLVIVGGNLGSDYFSKYAEKIKFNLPKNIEFLDTVSEKKLLELFSCCKGFISTARDEDFGMAVVEAMASGKAVICVKEGGFLESVIDNVTGIFVQPKVDEIIKAIKSISKNPAKYKEACIERSKEFDVSFFVKNMKESIQNIISKNNSD